MFWVVNKKNIEPNPKLVPEIGVLLFLLIKFKSFEQNKVHLVTTSQLDVSVLIINTFGIYCLVTYYLAIIIYCSVFDKQTQVNIV